MAGVRAVHHIQPEHHFGSLEEFMVQCFRGLGFRSQGSHFGAFGFSGSFKGTFRVTINLAPEALEPLQNPKLHFCRNPIRMIPTVITGTIIATMITV